MELLDEYIKQQSSLSVWSTPATSRRGKTISTRKTIIEKFELNKHGVLFDMSFDEFLMDKTYRVSITDEESFKHTDTEISEDK